MPLPSGLSLQEWWSLLVLISDLHWSYLKTISGPEQRGRALSETFPQLRSTRNELRRIVLAWKLSLKCTCMKRRSAALNVTVRKYEWRGLNIYEFHNWSVSSGETQVLDVLQTHILYMQANTNTGTQLCAYAQTLTERSVMSVGSL